MTVARTLNMHVHPETMRQFLAVQEETQAGSHAETLRLLLAWWKRTGARDLRQVFVVQSDERTSAALELHAGNQQCHG